MKVLVLLGGKSNERDVSLRSGRAIADAAKTLGHDVTEFDPAEGYEGLKQFVGKVDVVLPILHGHFGEDGEIQKELDGLGLKYLGANAKVSELCFDKAQYRDKVKSLGITVAPGEVVSLDEFKNSELIKSPYVLKPIRGGSTLDTFIVREIKDIPDLTIFEKYGHMLLEKLIEGTEITVPVLNGKALPVIEIVPPEGMEFDYDNKYNGATQELCPPESVSEELQRATQELAIRIHNELGIAHLSRTDIIIDNSSKIWVLETNTMPGMTSQSLFPKSAKISGLPFEQLVAKFIELAS